MNELFLLYLLSHTLIEGFRREGLRRLHDGFGFGWLLLHDEFGWFQSLAIKEKTIPHKVFSKYCKYINEILKNIKS